VIAAVGYSRHHLTLCIAHGAVVGKVGKRCVYASNHERGYVVVAVPQRFSRPASLSRVSDD